MRLLERSFQQATRVSWEYGGGIDMWPWGQGRPVGGGCCNISDMPRLGLVLKPKLENKANARVISESFKQRDLLI